MAAQAGSGLVEGKVAVVTGGGAGIGRATAELFAAEGARLVLADFDAERGREAVRAIETNGGEACFVEADVSREQDVEQLIDTAVERFGRLDCAVNNAGTSGAMGPIQTVELEAWRRTLDVNLTGVFLCLKHELRVMQPQGAGAIVNVASGSGVIATPYLAAYCASKHGVLGLTKTAAVENAKTGVRINAVCPGSTDTPMLRASMQASPEIEKLILGSTPGGRLGEAFEIAQAAVWLCSDRASFVSGESMLVDGGAVAR